MMNNVLKHNVWIFLSLLFNLAATNALAQGGGGSRGGVVMACFDVPDEKLNTVLEPTSIKDLWKWPRQDRGHGESDTDFKKRLHDSVSHLTYAQLDEYRDVEDVGPNGATNLILDPAYHMHPLMRVLSEVARNAAIKVPLPGMPQYSPESLTLTSYFSPQFFDLDKEEQANRDLFKRVYLMMVETFRGVPGFYMRLKAAQDHVPWIFRGNPAYFGLPVGGDFDGESLSHSPLPKGCVWMRAVNRWVNDNNPDDVTIEYDPYLWQHMDVFQRALLQLHEELYYFRWDAKKLNLDYEKIRAALDGTRRFLVEFLEGERDAMGAFVSDCASYELDGTSTPGTFISSSLSCKFMGTFVRASQDALQVKTWLRELLTRPKADSAIHDWTEVASSFGPFTPEGLVTLISKKGFGNYHSLPYLERIRQRAVLIADRMLVTYAGLVNGYCAAGAFGRGIAPLKQESSAYLARRILDEKTREQLIRKGKILPGDLKAIDSQTLVLQELQRSYNGNELPDLTELADDRVLYRDYPDELLKRPLSEFATSGAGSTTVAGLTTLDPVVMAHDLSSREILGRLNDACGDLRDRLKQIDLFEFKMKGDGKTPPLSFYNPWPLHTTLLERALIGP
jgi:hypothetical protein